jgi:RHS repeat-associated protein
MKPGPLAAGPAPQLSCGGANNRIDQYAHDAAGDVTGDGVHSYTYDAENRLVSVDGGSTATYAYDALGRRVEKTTSAGSVYYLYDLAGNVVTELSATGGWNRTEIYAGGKHVATYSNSTTYFDHVDWLGTERARTDAQGGMTETCTSLAFGDDLSCSGTDGSPLHFTGKQRDTETGNDDFGARYYGSGADRFMSSDPANAGATPLNPQSWNAYSYVLNNPLSVIDPLGLWPTTPPPPGEGWTEDRCGMDGAEFSCGLLGEFASGVGEAECPNDVCSGVQNGQFAEFEVGAGGAEGFLNPDEIATENNECGGEFCSESGYRDWAVRQNPAAAASQKQAVVSAIALQLHISYSDAAKLVASDTSYLQGGNLNFKVGPSTALRLCGSAAADCRLPGGLHIHRGNGGYYVHKDTGCPTCSLRGFFKHVLVDFILGNSAYNIIPRPW